MIHKKRTCLLSSKIGTDSSNYVNHHISGPSSFICDNNENGNQPVFSPFFKRKQRNTDLWTIDMALNKSTLCKSEFQQESAELLNVNNKLTVELSFYEMLALQNILLLRPEQNSESMVHIFGQDVLSSMYGNKLESLMAGCPELSSSEITELQTLVDNYQMKISDLKHTTFDLVKMTLDKDDQKTAVINAIRRLVDKLPMTESLDLITSETEVWSMFADPVLDSLLSNPEDKIHLRWTNVKDSSDQKERPDGIILVKSQSRWGRNYGHGEAKIAEPKDNVYVLAWDLCRLGYFNKSLINTTNTKMAFAFQVKGFSITFYITELEYDGMYTMCEIGSIEIPHAVTKLDAMVTRQYLCTLMQIAYIFEKVKTQRIDDDIVNMKRDGPTLTQLENMLSKKRDRNLPCAVRF